MGTGGVFTHYVGNRMIVSGSFDLSRSPYGASPNAVPQPGSGVVLIYQRTTHKEASTIALTMQKATTKPCNQPRL